MKYEVATPSRKFMFALESRLKRKLHRAALDIEEKVGAHVSIAYLINMAVDQMDARAVVEKFKEQS